MKRVNIGIDTTVISNNQQITMTQPANLYFTWFGGEVVVFNNSGGDCVVTGRFVLNDGVNDVDSYTISDQETVTFAWDNGYYVTPQSTEIDRVSGMSKAVYDPNDVEGDAFNMDNMVDGTTNKVFTATEETKLDGIEAGAEANNISDADALTLTDGSNADDLHIHSGSSSDTSIVIAPASFADTDAINTFLAAQSGKKVRFQRAQTYVITKQLILDTLTNVEIDFNECVFKLEQDPTHVSVTVGNYSGSEPTCLMIGDCDNLKISNGRFDGEVYNITNEATVNVCQGIYISACNNVIIEKCEFDDFNYKGIVVSSGCVDVKCVDIVLRDVYGKATSSYFYVGTSVTDRVVFDRIYAKQTTFPTGVSESNQVFYIDGYNSTITNLYAENTNQVIDYRKGRHSFSNVFARHCGAILVTQPQDTNLPSVYGDNMIGEEIYGASPLNSGAFINGCEELVIKGFRLEMSTAQSQATTGLRFDSAQDNRGVRLSDITLNGASNRAIWYKNSDSYFTYIKNLSVDQSAGYAYYADGSGAVTHIIDGYTFYDVSAVGGTGSLVKKREYDQGAV